MRVPFDTQPFVGPSGRTLTYADLVLLVELKSIGMIAWLADEIPFHKGFLSHIYVQGRNDLSDHPSILRRLCARIKETVEKLPLTHGPQRCMIGIPTAGTPLAQGISMLSEWEQVTHVRDSREPPIAFRSMRSKLKGHGKDRKWVGDADIARHSYVFLENVISTASGMLKYLGHAKRKAIPGAREPPCGIRRLGARRDE